MTSATLVLVFVCAAFAGLVSAWPQVNLSPRTTCYEETCPEIPYTPIFPGLYEIPANHWDQAHPNDVMSNTPIGARVLSDLTENWSVLRGNEFDYHTLAHNGSNVSLKIWLGIQGCASRNLVRKLEVGVFADAAFPAAAESAKNVPASEFSQVPIPTGHRLVGSMVVDTRQRATNRFIAENGINFYAPASFVPGCAVAPAPFGPPQTPCDLSAAIDLVHGVTVPAGTLTIIVQEALGKLRTPYVLVTGEVPPAAYKFAGVTDETLVRNFYHQLEVGKLVFGNRQHKNYCELD